MFGRSIQLTALEMSQRTGARHLSMKTGNTKFGRSVLVIWLVGVSRKVIQIAVIPKSAYRTEAANS
jgi:hypothetical protein